MFKNKLGLRNLFRRRKKDDDDSLLKKCGVTSGDERHGDIMSISPTKTEVTVESRGIDTAFLDATLQKLPRRSRDSTLSSTQSLDGHNYREDLPISGALEYRRTRSESRLDDYCEIDNEFSRTSSDLSTAMNWVSSVPNAIGVNDIRAADSDDDSLGSMEFLLDHMCGPSHDDLSASEEDIEMQLTRPSGSLFLSVMNGMCSWVLLLARLQYYEGLTKGQDGFAQLRVDVWGIGRKGIC